MYTNSRPKFLDQLVTNHRLTSDGRDWLICALDPFHDLNHQAAGYPDADGSQTIVSCYQYQADISAPAGVAGNWDAHFYTTPFATSQTMRVGLSTNYWATVTETAATAVQGPLSIITGPSGSPLIPVSPAAPNTEFRALPAAGVEDLASGVTRIIGIGYEVTNTTADMYKQGAVTSYRMPQYTSAPGAVVVRNAGGTQQAQMPTTRWRLPPTSTAEANLLKGTRTWDAAAGVYATAVQNSTQNPLLTVNHTMMIMDDEPMPNAGAGQVLFTPYVTQQTNPSPAVSLCVPNVTQAIPYDTTGSMFTGLSNATTLTVKVKFYVERAPTMAESSLCVLATPSAGLDHVALELYSHAVSQLPVAVTVGENGLGDWFRGVVRVLKDVAGTAVPIISRIVPGASIPGTAVQQILGGMDSILSKGKNRPSVSASIPRPVPAQQTSNKPKPKPLRKKGLVARLLGKRSAR